MSLWLLLYRSRCGPAVRARPQMEMTRQAQSLEWQGRFRLQNSRDHPCLKSLKADPGDD